MHGEVVAVREDAYRVAFAWGREHLCEWFPRHLVTRRPLRVV